MKTNEKFLFVLIGICAAILALSSCTFIELVLPREPDAGNVVPSGGDGQPDDSDNALVGCLDVKAYTLSVDHTLTISEPETELTHILQHGSIGLLISTETDKGDCAITTAAPQTIPYEYMGVVGTCSVDAQGEVILSASGYCEDGIVYLVITEDWQATSGTMTCDDTVVPFPIAAYSAVHSGETGNGEEFLITAEQNGYTVMREFLEGDGYHSWTLAYDVELVPLAPDDD